MGADKGWIPHGFQPPGAGCMQQTQQAEASPFLDHRHRHSARAVEAQLRVSDALTPFAITQRKAGMSQASSRGAMRESFSWRLEQGETRGRKERGLQG